MQKKSYGNQWKVQNWDNQSNKWDIDIDVEKVKEKEKEELNEMIKIVKEKEELISQTEMMMQQKSLYSDTYKPQFISEIWRTIRRFF